MKVKTEIMFIKMLISAFFIFMCMFFPTNYALAKALPLAALAILGLAGSSWLIKGPGQKFIYMLVLANMAFILLGLMNGFPGAIRTISLNIVWPVLFLCFSQIMIREIEMLNVVKMMLASEYAVCIFDILYIIFSLAGTGYPEIMNYFIPVLNCSFGHYGAFIAYTTTHMCTHIFMFPFVFFLVTADQRFVSKKAVWILLFLEMICYLLSGRVAFYIAAAAAVCLIYLLKILLQSGRIKKGRGKHFSLFVIILFIVFIGILIVRVSGTSLDGIWGYIENKFITSSDAANDRNGVRAVQAYYLISEWLKSPLFGWGAGAYIRNYLRSTQYAFAYEYTYLALLFQKGIAGFAIQFSLYIWIILCLIKKSRKPFIDRSVYLAYAGGFLSILIANAADPYMETLGSMWMVYFPFMLANAGQENGGLNEETKQ